MDNRLVKANVKLGQAVLAEARKQNEEKKKQKVVEEVKTLLVVIEELKRDYKMVKTCLEYNENKLKAIEEGKFDFDYDTLTMNFHDKDFNNSWHKILSKHLTNS